MKKIILILILSDIICISFSLRAQQKDSIRFKKNAIYFGLNSGLSYERVLFTRKKTKIIGRVFGIYLGGENEVGIYSPKYLIPSKLIGTSLIYARSFNDPNYHLDVEILYADGQSMGINGSQDYKNLTYTIRVFTHPIVEKYFLGKIGWRRQRPDGGWVCRMNAGLTLDKNLYIVPEIALGYSF